MAGYSPTPLVKKLGIKENFRVRVHQTPTDYRALVAPLPKSVMLSPSIRNDIDMWHIFTRHSLELKSMLEKARHSVKPAGMIWVSWPKKSSGVKSEISEDTIRDFALPIGLVDIKVCAVDDTWSGLKLVIRKELRF